MEKELLQRIVDLEEEIVDLQQQLEAQDKIPDMRDWERLLERLESEKRISNCLTKALDKVTEELEDWKQRCMRLERELNESREYMDIDYDREY